MHRFLSIGLLFSIVATSASASSLDSKTEQALLRALDDERAAAALYNAVIAQQGEIRPFTNIVQAEVRHADHLLPLFEQYGIAVPEDAWDEKSVDVPGTRTEACTQAIEAEIANIALYDEFLEFVEQSDVRDVFTRLRDASRDRHLPAFERCASGSGGGQGHGRRARDGSCAGAGSGIQQEDSVEDAESESGNR